MPFFPVLLSIQSKLTHQMSDIDWSTFTTRISIKSDRKTIFNAWMTQESIESWFLRDASFFQNGSKINSQALIEKGHTYAWMWHGSEVIAEGEVLEIIDDDSIQFTFLGCTVNVSFKVDENEEVVEITQSKIPLDDKSRLNYYVGCTRGWTFYLANLKSILEGGIDLRNKNMELKNVVST